MKLLITGDFCPINRASDVTRSDSIFGAPLLAEIKNADFAITNLECPLTSSSKPIPKTGPALKADVESIKILRYAGFNLVTLANNHILDYAEQGLKDTLNVLKQNQIAHVGAGKIEDNIGTTYLKKDGLTVAVINICENEWSTNEYNGYSACGLDPVKNFNAIQTAGSRSDKVIVIHHGGHEMYELPSPRMKELFRFFVIAGADAVINHHTHCISGYEIYKNAPIFYSLGNFVFDNSNYRENIWNHGLIVTLEIHPEKINFDFKAVEQFSHQPIVRLLDKNHAIYGKVRELNHSIENDAVLAEEFTEFIKTKQKMYTTYLEPYKNKYRAALKNRGLLPSAWNSRKRLYLKNLIKCESHREIVLNLLDNEIRNTQQ